MKVIQLVGTGLVATVAVLAWAFAARYLRRPWRRTREGIHLMSLTLMVATFTTLATETRIWGPYPGSPVVAVVLYGLLAVLMVRQHWLLSDADNIDR